MPSAECISDRALSVERLDHCSAAAVARIHFESLPEDVLPALGRDFLEKYYRQALRSPTQVVIGALIDGSVIGFCQLSLAPVRILDVLRAEPLSLFRILALMLFNIRIFINGYLLAVTRPREFEGQPEISFIAVKREHRGQGVAKRLVEDVNRRAMDLGLAAVVTKTANPLAKSLYERMFDAQVVSVQEIGRRDYWYLRWNSRSQTHTSDDSTSSAR